MPAEEWHPYSPANFITPPFPGYVSGHSCVSAAAAKTLELFTGSDRFGETEKRKAGELTEAEYECKIIQMKLGQSPADATLTCDVALRSADFFGDGRNGWTFARDGRLSHPSRQRRRFGIGTQSFKSYLSEN